MTDTHLLAAVQSRVGSTLGSYQITQAISAGGMGAVYRAQHTLLGSPAAIKILRPDLTDNHELVQRFFNEAKAASAIRHPGIVEVKDFGYTNEGEAYLVMELLEGEPLSKRLKGRRFSEVIAAHLARGIASALKAAHGKGIIHRDLKPDNVFLVPDPDVPTGERAKVLDFGIAKLTDEAHSRRTRHTQTGALIGTPSYMAPEQAAAAGDVDHRADLYSLGCLLYEMLCGEPPFVAEGAGEIIAMQMFASPHRPSTRLAAISTELEAITMRLLEKDPANRFQSASEVVDALGGMSGRLSGRVATQIATTSTHDVEMILTPRPVETPRPMPTHDAKLPVAHGDPTRVSKRSGPSGLAIISGALLVAVSAIGIALAVTMHKGSDDPPPPPAPPERVVTPPPVKELVQRPDPPTPEPPRPPDPPKPVKHDPPRPKPVTHDTPIVKPVETPKRPEPPKKHGCVMPDGSPCEDEIGELPKPK